VNKDGSLTYNSVTATGGAIPRHFSIDPAGKWLLAANQESGAVTVLKLDPETGALSPNNQSASFLAAQFVQVIDLNQYKKAP
jgi:6-phosphogluconolactonase